MTWHDAETFDLTLNRYRAVVAEVLAICPQVEISCNEFNQRVLCPRAFSPAHGYEKRELTAHATSLSIQQEPLFEGNRPKEIAPNYWTWKSDFFSTRFYKYWTVELLAREPGYAASAEYTDDDGNFHKASPAVPARIRPIGGGERVTLQLYERRFGLGWWKKNRVEILALACLCNEEIKGEYAAAISKADTEIGHWLDALKKPAVIEIPE